MLLFFAPGFGSSLHHLGHFELLEPATIHFENRKRVFFISFKMIIVYHILDISITVDWYQVGKKFWQLLWRLFEIIKTEILPSSHLFCYPETFSIKTLSFTSVESLLLE